MAIVPSFATTPKSRTSRVSTRPLLLSAHAIIDASADPSGTSQYRRTSPLDAWHVTFAAVERYASSSMWARRARLARGPPGGVPSADAPHGAAVDSAGPRDRPWR